ncbi:unnamed protein product [Cladocopium goreaui]|uniref:Uncharacterized protein n=1 Tax=Cladocopium goreaui TaxID=2562237 RepID=A0A9P1CK86_9DINO|nr:unnamed protein product [Cladocopium goreaui]
MANDKRAKFHTSGGPRCRPCLGKGFARALLQSVAVKKEATESRDHGSLGLGAGNVAGRPFKEQPHVVTESQELCFLWKPKGRELG